MKLLSFIKKSVFVLSLLPLFTISNIYADTSGLVAKGEHHAEEGHQHHGISGHHHEDAHPAAHMDMHRAESRGLHNANFNRGVEAGAVGGAAIEGAANNGSVIVAPQPQVQYVSPVTPPNL